MYAKQFAPLETRRPHFLATLLYTFIYALLWLRHRARTAYFRLHRYFQHAPTPLFKPLQTHLAFSGHIAPHLDHLSKIIVFLANHGTTHITLYDHLQHINPTHLASLIHRHGLHAFHLSRIAIHETESFYSTCNNPPTSHQCHPAVIESAAAPHPRITLTIVDPGTGRASIARSARLLAERQAGNTPYVDPQTVTEWLDADHARCMLPSEPDTLVVFPSPTAPSAPVLNGFPVWQLRLTQIRFSSIPLTHCSTHQLMTIITSAANAPKRFGR